MVHQHFKLVPSLTVAANIFLGKETSNAFGKLDQRAMEKRVGELSQSLGLKINRETACRTSPSENVSAWRSSRRFRTIPDC